MNGSGAGIGGAYVWDGGITDGIAFIPAATTTYTVTGTDANGCENTDDVTVTVNPLPIIDAGLDHAVCFGDETTLNGAGAGIGGSYVWDGGITDGVAFIPAATTTYTVTGTDANGCENTDDVTVTVNPLPIIDAGLDHAVCIGNETTLAGSGAGIDGIYVWDGGITDGVAFTPAATATYTVIGTDANGCVGSDEVTVTVNLLLAVDAGPDHAVCIGDETILTGSGAGIGGTYVWDGGVTDGVAFTPAATATYTVTGTDINGCENTDDVIVTVNPLPIIDAGLDHAVCIGDATTLNGSGAGIGGIYVWDGGVSDGVAFTPAATATYTVTGTDANGCENTDDVVVTVNALPAVDAGDDVTLCVGDWVTLTGSGAGPEADYLWTGGGIDGVAFSPGITDDYEVTGTDEFGCVNTDEVTVTVNPLPIIDAGLDQEVCAGDGVVLEGSGAGVGGSYIWDGGITDGVEFVPGVTTTYTVTGTDENGCIGTDDATVVVIPLPNVSFTADELIGCAPMAVNFSSLIDGVTYEWAFGDGAEGSTGSVSHTYTNAGLYDVTLTITTTEGCIGTMTYEGYIDIVEPPIASFSYSPYEITVMDTRVSFTNESLNADSYEWTFGDGSGVNNEIDPDHVYPSVGDVHYTVQLIAYSDYGCQDVVEQIIEVKDVMIYHIPNTFTPDGDSFNESFKPQFISGLDIYDYHLMVFNRWGEMVFESFNADYGWDGFYGNMGLVDDGVYIWKMEFGETMSDKKHYVDGHVTVLK